MAEVGPACVHDSESEAVCVSPSSKTPAGPDSRDPSYSESRVPPVVEVVGVRSIRLTEVKSQSKPLIVTVKGFGTSGELMLIVARLSVTASPVAIPPTVPKLPVGATLTVRVMGKVFKVVVEFMTVVLLPFTVMVPDDGANPNDPTAGTAAAYA